ELLKRRRKLPYIPEDADFDLKLSTGKKEYFLSRNPRGFVFGPRSPELKSGLDDHLTTGEDRQGKFQIHRTVDKRKVWWHTEDSMRAEFQRVWTAHSKRIKPEILDKSGTHVISFRRLIATLSVFQ